MHTVNYFYNFCITFIFNNFIKNIYLLNSYRCADHYYSIDDVAADCVICSYLCGNCLFRDKYCLTCTGGDNRTPWTDLNYHCLYQYYNKKFLRCLAGYFDQDTDIDCYACSH